MENASDQSIANGQPVRVLQLMWSVSSGGIESLVLSLVEELSTNPNFDFSIAAMNPVDPVHEIKFENLGVKVHFISNAGLSSTFTAKLLWRIRGILNFRALIASLDYEVLHCHLGVSHTPYTLIAWLYGIRIRIVHAHPAGRKDTSRLVSKFRRFKSILGLECLVTHKIGCGDLSTRWMWGDAAFEKTKARTIYNGIPIGRFERAREARAASRRTEGGRANLVHIGRFSEPKNQRFLLEVFNEIAARLDAVHLDIVGFGPLEAELKRHVSSLGLCEQVTFHEQTTDVADLLSRADAFLLPSLSEGLPIVAIESQVAGVPVVASDAVTAEIDMGLTMFLPLDLGAAGWAQRIIAMLELNPFSDQPSPAAARRFDIAEVGKEWAEVYLSGRLTASAE